MDQLADYSSSDDDAKSEGSDQPLGNHTEQAKGTSGDRPHHFTQQSDRGKELGGLRDATHQPKRQKIADTSSTGILASAAGARGGVTPQLRAGAAAVSKLGALPDPLALLGATTDEERQDLLSTANAASVQLTAPPRVRTFPHVVGNFPTVVLLPVQGMDEPLDAVYRKIRRLLPDLEPMATESDADQGSAAGGPPATGRGGRRGASPPAARRGYHISLSRTVPIRHPQIAPLTSLLSERLASVRSRFTVLLAESRSFVNDEGTRSFVSIMVAQGSEQICAMIRQVDAAFAVHGLPPFYEVPLPHVSVGWLPGDQRGRIDAALSRLCGPAPGVAVPSAAAAAAPAFAAPAAGLGAGSVGKVCSWQASSALCVVGQREYEVWRP